MDFPSLLHQYRVSFHQGDSHTREGWINFRCPYCLKDPYMGYNLGWRYVNCWSCGRHPLYEVIHRLTLLPLVECVALCKGLPVNDTPRTKKTGTLKPPDGVGPLTDFHRQYLRNRGFNSYEIESLWGIQGIALETRESILKWRLFIPITLHGEVVSWTTRSIGSRSPRYYSAKDESSAISVRDLIYGMDFVRNTMVLVEGPVDVWRVGPGACAIMGVRASTAQLAQASRIPLRAVCFDNEPDAQRRARKLCGDLCVFPGRTVNVVLETGKDPGEASRKEIESLRKEFLL